MLSRKPIHYTALISPPCFSSVRKEDSWLCRFFGAEQEREREKSRIFVHITSEYSHLNALPSCVYTIQYTMYSIHENNILCLLFIVCVFFFLTCFPFSWTCKNLSCGFYMHGMVIGNGKSLLSLLSRVQIRIRLSGFTISLQYDIRTKISGHRDGGEISPSWCI